MATNSKDEIVAVKVYRIYRTSHRHSILKSSTSKASIRSAIGVQNASYFAMKEYDTLSYLYDKGIPCPCPYDQKDFAFTMDYYGDDNGPYPLIKDIDLISQGYEPIDVLEAILDIYYRMFNYCECVHGDFSEHNILWKDGELVIIDFLQSKKYYTSSFSPEASYGERISKISAFKMMEKDVKTILYHFLKKYRASFEEEEVIKGMIDLEDDKSLWRRTYEHMREEKVVNL